jgi:hypothetical protein
MKKNIPRVRRLRAVETPPKQRHHATKNHTSTATAFNNIPKSTNSTLYRYRHFTPLIVDDKIYCSMSRPTLDGIRQASVGALDKAKLMVGLNKNSGDLEEDSQQSERSGFVGEAVDLMCPELTFQQRLIGFATCFTVGCKSQIFWISWSAHLLMKYSNPLLCHPPSSFLPAYIRYIRRPHYIHVL